MLQGAAGGGRRGGRGRPTRKEMEDRKKEELHAAAKQAYAEDMREIVRVHLAGETTVEEFEEEVILLTQELNNILNT